MKNSELISNTSSVARHRIFVPGHAPFLELRTTLDSALPYAEHFHSAFSLGLILQGKTRFSLGDAAYLVEEGDIVLISQGRAHRIGMSIRRKISPLVTPAHQQTVRYSVRTESSFHHCE